MNETTQDNMEMNENRQQTETQEDKKDIEALECALGKACSERDDLKDKYQRTFSDFNNYKKRMVSARADAIKDGQCDAIEKMLPVMDSFERALEHIDDCEEQTPVVQGTKMVYRQMCEVLEKLGVKEIPALGEVFDPNLHQAMQMIEPEEGAVSGTIASVVQKGYMQGDRVIRNSMVIVNK